MNENEIIGVRRMEGKSRKTGKPYSGYLVYYQYVQNGTEGVACDSAFLPDSLLNAYIPVIGQTVSLFYDRRGFLVNVELH